MTRLRGQTPDTGLARDSLIGLAVGLFILLILIVFCTALFCRSYRWRESIVSRWGQPNPLRDAPCYCYPEVWVTLCPACMPVCRDRLPTDRTAPVRAPAAALLTGASTRVTPDVANNPPPSYEQLQLTNHADTSYNQQKLTNHTDKEAEPPPPYHKA